MEQAALTVVRTARYVLRRSAEARREGRDDSSSQRAFHLLVRVLRALILEGMPPENVKPLLDFLDKSGLAAKIEDSRLDSRKRPSQKGGGRGHGQWVTIHGTHIFIDGGGTVTKGPAKFVGLTASEAMSQPEMSGSGGKAQSSIKPSAEGRNKPCTGFRDQAASVAEKACPNAMNAGLYRARRMKAKLDDMEREANLRRFPLRDFMEKDES